MTPCHACTSPAGPSGFCATHRNRLNARAALLLDHMDIADRIALAAHPGWRGRAYRLVVVLNQYGEPRYTCVSVEAARRMWAQSMRVFDTAPEALAELDRRNGLPAAADLDALRLRVAEVERQATEQRHRAEAAEDALIDIAAIARGEMVDPWPPGEPKPDTIAGRAYDAVCWSVRACASQAVLAYNTRTERDDARAERDAFATAADEYRRQAEGAREEAAEVRGALGHWRGVAKARGWGIVGLAVALAVVVPVVVAAVGGGS